MTSGGMGATLRGLRKLFEGEAYTGLADSQLLGRFVSRGDDEAFAVLVSRHGPMVLATCLGVLRDHHDVEDAFQATFLVLARRARTIREADSLGGWLHRVSLRVASRLNAEARRRQSRERPFDQGIAGPEALDRGPDDWAAVLHREVGRLPDRYRMPIVLCDLEQLTRSEAAAQLGWPEGTVAGRLARARRLLKEKLARRGIAHPAGLLLGLPRAGIAPRKAWCDAVVKSARSFAEGGSSGSGSSKVAALAGAVASTMSGASLAVLAVKGALVALVVSSAVGWAWLAAQEPPPIVDQGVARAANPRPEPPPEKPDGADPLVYAGIVLDLEGRPVSGAKIQIAYFIAPDHFLETGWKNFPMAVSALDGRFRFEVRRSDFDKSRFVDPWTFVSVNASCQGYGPVGVLARTPALPGAILKNEDLTLRMARSSQPIRGRIVDAEGRAVAGAEIRPEILYFAQNARGESIPFDDHSHVGGGTMSDLPTKGVIPSVTSDLDGRFTLPNVGDDRLIKMTISAPGFVSESVDVITRPIASEAIPAPGVIEDNFFPKMMRHGRDFTHVLATAKPIVGTVREEESGLPIAGLKVQNTVTDAEGRYRISDLGRKPFTRFLVYPDHGLPYLPQKVKVADSTDGFDPITADITLKRGVKVEGQVVDRVTGRPAPGWLRYLPLRDNPNTRAYSMTQETYANLDAEGRFSICALPGKGVLMVDSSTNKPPAYRPAVPAFDRDGQTGQNASRIDTAFQTVDLSELNAYRIIEAPVGVMAMEVNLTVDSGLTVEGKIEDTEGKPVEGVTVFGIGPPPFDKARMVNGRFRALALDPIEPRRLFFYQPARKLAGHLVLQGQEPSPVVVRLGPCPRATGRLVNAEGLPIVGANLGRAYEDGENRVLVNFPSGSFEKLQGGSLQTGIKTDADGRFLLDEMVAGVKFRLEASLLNRRNSQVLFLPDRPLEPGQVLDLGDVEIDDEN